jgi:hypothetical protein
MLTRQSVSQKFYHSQAGVADCRNEHVESYAIILQLLQAPQYTVAAMQITRHRHFDVTSCQLDVSLLLA